MKRILFLVIPIFCLLSACGTAPIKSSEITSDEKMAYSYKIDTSFDNSSSNGRNPILTFSRPVFEETSELAKEINQIYAELEKPIIDKMMLNNGPIPDEVKLLPDYPWHYTELSECTYEKSGIVSFVLNGDWYMGGVQNSWKIGHTFDFTLGRELKINDVLRGDESQITAALENEFYNWYKKENGYEISENSGKDNLKKESGLDTNFYLAGDGLHVIYIPHIATLIQNGIDILIPWTRTDLVRPQWTS